LALYHWTGRLKRPEGQCQEPGVSHRVEQRAARMGNF